MQSQYLEQQLINHMLFGISYTPPAHYYLALYSDEAYLVLDGFGTELSGSGYARQMITPLNIGSNFYGQNPDNITFPTATGSSWGYVMSAAIIDSPTGGNILVIGDIDPPVSVNVGQTFRINANNLYFSFRNANTLDGGWTNTYANTMMKLVFNGVSDTYSKTYQVAIGRNISLNAYWNLLSWTECSGVNYSRQTLPVGEWSGPDAFGFYTNTNEINFTDSASGDWGLISDIVLYPSNATTVPALWGHLGTSMTITSGCAFSIGAGAIQIKGTGG